MLPLLLTSGAFRLQWVLQHIRVLEIFCFLVVVIYIGVSLQYIWNISDETHYAILLEGSCDCPLEKDTRRQIVYKLYNSTIVKNLRVATWVLFSLAMVTVGILLYLSLIERPRPVDVLAEPVGIMQSITGWLFGTLTVSLQERSFYIMIIALAAAVQYFVEKTQPDMLAVATCYSTDNNGDGVVAKVKSYLENKL